MSKIFVFDIEVAFYPEVIAMCRKFGLDEKRLSWKIDANLRYVTHISIGNLGERAVKDLSLLDYPGSLVGDANEKALLEDFVKLFNEADETVAHYGSKFDIKFLNTRLAKYGLPSLKPTKLRDTWRMMKDKFLLLNNRLDTAIKFFGCPYGKPHLEWKIWERVSNGDRAAHKILRHRCRFDVKSLRWIYENKLRVHDRAKMNRALSYDTPATDDAVIREQLKAAHCPTCEKVGTMVRRGYLRGKVSTQVQLSCRNHACQDWLIGTLVRIAGSKKNEQPKFKLGVIR
jgi:hypothetical protein